MKILLIILLLFLICILLLLILSSIRPKRRNSEDMSINKDPSIIYSILCQKPIIGKYIKNIRNQLFINNDITEQKLQKKSVLIAAASVILPAIIFYTLNLLYKPDIYFGGGLLIISIWLGTRIKSIFIKNNNEKFLYSLIDYINDLKHYFHASNRIDEAFYEADLRARKEMLTQGQKIYSILTKSHSKEKLDSYYKKCSDKFLRVIAGLAYMTQEYGDKKVNNVSLFIRNLNYIIEDIQNDILNKKDLEYYLSGLKIIVLGSFFTMPLIENWLIWEFPVTQDFFKSYTGCFIKYLLFLIIFTCYVFIAQLRSTGHKEAKPSNTPFFKLLNLNIINKLVKTIIKKASPPKKSALKQLLEEAGSGLNLEHVYFLRIFAAALMFTASFIVIISGHNANSSLILNNPSFGIKDSKFYQMVGQLDSDTQKENAKISELDRQVISLVQNAKNELSKKQLRKYILNLVSKKGYDQSESNYLSSLRIYNKLVSLCDEHTKWWEILIAFTLSYMFSFLPILLLEYEKSFKKADMEEEVLQFQTIIIILMHQKNIDVRTILEWMCNYSVLFKIKLEKCLNNFQNPDRALNELKTEIKFKPFVRLIDNLLMAGRNISIESAFDSVEMEREFYKECRKGDNQKAVRERITKGKIIGFIPVYSVLILYLIVPVFIAVFTSMNQVTSQLK